MKAQLNMISNEPNSEKPKKSLTESKTYSIIAVILLLFFIQMGILFWMVMNGEKMTVKYDCRQLIGGWHPDVPPEVMEECRKRNSGRI
jgi:hypothetical protein